MTNTRIRVLLAVGALLLLAQGAAQAQINLVTSRPALGGTDFIDWGVLGPAFTQVPSPFSILSNGGHNVNVSQAGSPFERRDQGNGWAGNFTAGDALLWTASSAGSGAGPITLNFGTPTSAFGMQIQDDFFGAFTARLTFFDALNNQVGTVTEVGNSTSAGDGSAIFIGGQSAGTATNFNSVVISMDAGGSLTDFAINRSDFTLASVGVPEPTSLALGAVSVVVAAGAVWQRRKIRKKIRRR